MLYLNFDTEFSDCKVHLAEFRFKGNETWICDGACQSWNIPCNGSCHDPKWNLNCKTGKCEDDINTHICHGQCLRFFHYAYAQREH